MEIPTVYLVLSRKRRECFAVCNSYRIAIQQKRRFEKFFGQRCMIEEKFVHCVLDDSLW